VTWLESSTDAELLKDRTFSVFGVGNSDWAQTFHRIPKLVDELMPKLGAKNIHQVGFADVKEDVMGPWEDWKQALVTKISGSNAEPMVAEELKVDIGKSDTAVKLAGEEISYGYVKKNDVIADMEVGPAKRHMEVELPEGTTYQTGLFHYC